MTAEEAQNYKSNITQQITIENIISYLKTVAPVNYVRNVMQSIIINAQVTVTKVTFPINYASNVTQNIVVQASVTVTKTVATVNYYGNVTQSFVVNGYTTVIKILAPIFYNRNTTQLVSLVGLVNVTKTTSPVNYRRNITQEMIFGNSVNVTKSTVTNINYTSNVSQEFSILQFVNVTKYAIPINYKNNVSQGVSISDYVSVSLVLEPANYYNNTTQQFSISDYVFVSKTVAGIKYYRNISQEFTIINSVSILKTVATAKYYSNISQDLNISNYVSISVIKVNPPNITSWGNSNTSNQNITLTVQKFTNITFNVTANQTVDTCSWSGATQMNCTGFVSYAYKNFTTAGINVVSVYVIYNTNGTSNTITWTVTVVGAGGLILSGYVNNSIQFYLKGTRVDLNGANYIFTDAGGYYEFTNLDEGNYTILVRQVGYRNNTNEINLTTSEFYNVTLSENKMAAVRATPGFEGVGVLLVIAIIIVFRRKHNV